MILVTGATGTTGSHVVRALIECEAGVRVFARDADKARDLFGNAVDVAVGDFAEPGTLRDALTGVDQLFLSCADDPRRVAWETDAIDAAVLSGVERIVKLSSISATPGSPVAFWDWHGQVEEHLRRAPVGSVILRASVFMTNVLAAADQVTREQVLPAPAGRARISMIDPGDVGAAAAAVLLNRGHDGHTYVLTGPEAITYETIAAELSTVAESEVDYIAVPDAAAREAMVHQGLPDPVAEQVVAIYGMLRQGVADQVSESVEALTGRSPRPFSAWARDHADVFAPAVGA